MYLWQVHMGNAKCCLRSFCGSNVSFKAHGPISKKILTYVVTDLLAGGQNSGQDPPTSSGSVTVTEPQKGDPNGM